MTPDLIMRRGAAFAIVCSYCAAQPNKTCITLSNQAFRHICLFCGVIGAYGIHASRDIDADRKGALWKLACQAEGAPVDVWIAGYEGEEHLFFCPNKKTPD